MTRLLIVAILSSLPGCGSRSITSSDGATATGLDLAPDPDLWPATPPSGVDLLFVIDDSNGTASYQQNLSMNFPKLLRALWREGRGLPDLHIGVVSQDLGAGPYSLPSCDVPGGEGGKLQTTPRKPGCVPPTGPWISHQGGQTNVPPSSDPVETLGAAFSCIAELGVGACGFEHTLEAGRRALDPALGVNPGFLRADTLLVVVFVTDEDDCSAADPALFDPSPQAIGSLGPLASFRCTEHGLICDEANLRAPGVKHNCRPGQTWLQPVERYGTFFRQLRPPGRVILAALAGPPSLVEVGLEGPNPVLEPTCQSINGGAYPAVRIHSVVSTFGADGLFNPGVVGSCAGDFSPALQLLGERIAAHL
jgi:hypothetical protein